ncbi:MAG TPA: RDD family protein [Ilumatobacteraceae bacterium]|jgi:uncharacterized RDD family membrane protein YckC
MVPVDDELVRPAIPAGATLATIPRRLAGLVVDQILVAIPVAVVAVALGFRPSDEITTHWMLAFSAGLSGVAFVYETLMIALLGRTVGKFAFGTRVVRMIDGQRPTWSQAAMRALVPLAFGAIPRIGVYLGLMVYSLALWNPLRQGLHDRAAGTLVVRR